MVSGEMIADRPDRHASHLPSAWPSVERPRE
jgi:hypothetical protein